VKTPKAIVLLYMVLSAFLFAGCNIVDDHKPAAEAAALHITQAEVAEITRLVSKHHPGQVIIGFDRNDDGSISVKLGDSANAMGGVAALYRKKNGHWYEATWIRGGWAV
jgi:hypothetical protein